MMSAAVRQGRRSLVGFAVLLALLAGCAPEPAPTGEAVIAFTLDKHKQYVVGFAIGTPTKLLSQTSSTFYLKSSHGATSVWKKDRVSVEQPWATITFAPVARGEKGPNVTDDVAAYYFRRPDGKLDLLPLTYVQPPVPSPPPIANPNFQYWTSEVYPSPVSWPISAQPQASFDVRVLGNYEGVRLSVASAPTQTAGEIATPSPRSVPSVSLTQSVNLPGSHLRARIRPFAPCLVRDGRLTIAAGLELTAPAGRPAIFCIGLAAFSGTAQLGDHTVDVTIVPGRIGAWNNVAFNIAATKSKFHGPLTLAIIDQLDATRSPYDWVTMDIASVANAP